MDAELEGYSDGGRRPLGKLLSFEWERETIWTNKGIDSYDSWWTEWMRVSLGERSRFGEDVPRNGEYRLGGHPKMCQLQLIIKYSFFGPLPFVVFIIFVTFLIIKHIPFHCRWFETSLKVIFRKGENHQWSGNTDILERFKVRATYMYIFGNCFIPNIECYILLLTFNCIPWALFFEMR